MSIKYNKETCKYDETTEPIFNPSTDFELKKPKTTHKTSKKESEVRDKPMSESTPVFDCETNGLLHDVSEIHCLPSMMPKRRNVRI